MLAYVLFFLFYECVVFYLAYYCICCLWRKNNERTNSLKDFYFT